MKATLIFTIKWAVEVDSLNMDEVLEKLRETGAAEVVDVDFQKKSLDEVSLLEVQKVR